VERESRIAAKRRLVSRAEPAASGRKVASVADAEAPASAWRRIKKTPEESGKNSSMKKFAVAVLALALLSPVLASPARPGRLEDTAVKEPASWPQEDEEPFPDWEEPPAPSVADPLEPLNRALFVVNDKAYFWVMKPVARGYAAAVPEGVRLSVRNFFSNLATPIRLVNNLIQGKVRRSGVELLRFAINSTIGMAGFFDPAKNDFLLEKRDEDLGQTFGRYGMGHGVYLVLPLLGPSSLRDAAGLVGDAVLDPVNYLGDVNAVLGAKAFKAENEISLRIGEYEELTKAAVDPYAAVRDAYIQYRAKQVRE
jgi:phospholipid-binding lipoprotein MlaA